MGNSTNTHVDTTADKNHELELTMLWLDAYELVHFLEESHLSFEAFSALPLNRTSLCWLLGALVAKVEALPQPCATKLVDVLSNPQVWQMFFGLPDLSDESTPFSMNELDMQRCWQAASVAAPELLRSLQLLPQVKAGQQRLARLGERQPQDWPQPDEKKPCRPDNTDLYQQLCAVMAQTLDSPPSPDTTSNSTLPVLRVWWLEDQTQITLALDHTSEMNNTMAQRIAQAVETQLGSMPVLISQLSLHPLLWDSTVASEVLVWKAADGSFLQLVPAAFAPDEHGHTHEV